MLSAIILAAGASKRMGKQKLLMEINGMSLLDRVICAVKLAGCFDEIILVYSEQEIRKKGQSHGLELMYNERAYQGISSSVITGIENANMGTGAYMFFCGDQPFVNKNIINFLVNEHNKCSDKIIVPLYDGQKGMPTIFPSEWRKELLQLQGDSGGRGIIERNINNVSFVDIEYKAAGMDIDTIEEYEAALKM